MAYEYDVKYHSEKAELYKQLQVAIRKHLEVTVAVLPPATIESLASELASFERYQLSEEKQVEEYRLKQAEETKLDAESIIDVDRVPETFQTEVTL